MGSKGIKTHKEDWKRDQRREKRNKKGDHEGRHEIESAGVGTRGGTLVRKVDNTQNCIS
jgi:hypothetical protein